MAANADKDHVGKGISLFDSLRHDHRAMSKVLGELKSAPPEQKMGLLSQLDIAFARHADSEERYFYLRLRRFSGLMELVHSALHEHDVIREFMEQLAREVQGSVGWQAIFSNLEYAYDQHVHKEEQLIFPRARRQLSPDELNRIMEQIEDEHRKTPLPPRHAADGERPA
jgi:hemerythrin superfamily protein